LDVPQEVVGSGEGHNALEEVRTYFLSLVDKEGVYLHQAKMVLVGNGEVGKTSIRIKLIDEDAPLPEAKDRTPGLDIVTYTVEQLSPSLTTLNQPIDFELNIWDFGGQGKYREIQQLFCSRKTLYLFVTSYDDLPDKDDYIGFEYWLSMVNAYSYDEQSKKASPVIHVVNKIDKKERHINRESLKRQFDNVERFVTISCKRKENLDYLREAIRTVLPAIDHTVFTDKYAPEWMAVKNELEQEEEPHITYQHYLAICKEHELDENAAAKWLNILDRIGAVIYFGGNEALRDWIILKPNWVKDALYKVIDDKDKKRYIENGVFRPAFFDLIWSGYSDAEHQKLISLMIAYELCYEQQINGKTQYVVPALLQEEEPEIPAYLGGQADYQVVFSFKPFIPAGIVNKLMIRLREYIFRAKLWKNNVILHEHQYQTNAYAHVWEAWADKMVYLNLYGNDVATLYHIIRNTLEDLTTTLKATKYMYQLDFEVQVKYKDAWESLSSLKRFGVSKFESFWTPFAANEELMKRGKIEQLTKMKPMGNRKKRVFVSYARKMDSDYVNTFIEGIKQHTAKEWDIFYDEDIDIGEKWDERLQAEVDKADFAILLLSPPFFNSEYIEEHEFKHFLKRFDQSNFKFFSIVLADCDYQQWEDVSSVQFFTSKGQDYGLEAYQDRSITYDQLFRYAENTGRLLPNSYRNKFHANFVQKVKKALSE
jgi:small GTP-binding protein